MAEFDVASNFSKKKEMRNKININVFFFGKYHLTLSISLSLLLTLVNLTIHLSDHCLWHSPPYLFMQNVIVIIAYGVSFLIFETETQAHRRGLTNTSDKISEMLAIYICCLVPA